jgi:hypothetical protein
MSDTERIKELQARIFDRNDLTKKRMSIKGYFIPFLWVLIGYVSHAIDSASLLEQTMLYGPTWFFFRIFQSAEDTSPYIGFVLVCIPTLAFLLTYVARAVTKPDARATYKAEALAMARDQGLYPISETAKALQLSGAGIPLATLNSTLIGIDQGADAGHIAVFAPSRSGKGLHLTATLIQWTAAAVVIDPKGEQWERTASLRNSRGRVYNIPYHSINILQFFDVNDPLELRELYTILLQTWRDKDPIFAEKAFSLFEAARDQGRATDENMLRILARWANSSPVLALHEAQEHAPYAVARFTDGSPVDNMNKFSLSAWGTFTARFTPYISLIDTISRGEIPPEWATKNRTIYITYSLQTLRSAGAVVSAIIAGLIKHQQRQVRKTSVLIAIDELPETAIPNIDSYLATVGGYGMTMLLYAQSIAQLREIYGHDRAEAIMANLNTQLYYRAADQATAKYLSAALGEQLAVNRSVSTQTSEERHEAQRKGKETEDRQSFSQSYKPILQPAEITALPTAAVLIFCNGIKTLGERLNPFNNSRLQLPPPPPLQPKIKSITTQHLILPSEVVAVSPIIEHKSATGPAPELVRSTSPQRTGPMAAPPPWMDEQPPIDVYHDTPAPRTVPLVKPQPSITSDEDDIYF